MLKTNHIWLFFFLVGAVVSDLTTARPKKARAHGVIQDEVDDYHEFDAEAVRNRANNADLRPVTFKPFTPKYDIPSVDAEEAASGVAKMMPRDGTVATLSPLAQQSKGLAKQTTIYAPQQQFVRKGYYYMHYPWDRLPRQYLLRPYYQYAYPTAQHNAVYAYTQPLPYTDPYGIYRNHPGNLSPCGSYGANGATGCGQSVGCGQSQGCGSGCSGGGGQGCGDQSFEENSAEFEDDEDTSGGRSGEAQLNKKDPLDDLDLEDLEKLDKAKDSDSKRRHHH